MGKLTYEEVKKVFEDGGCELLGEYINCDTKVEYRCNCGNISKILLHNFRKGNRCKKCNKNKYTFEYVKRFFEEQRCELLEKEYVNSKTKMRYKCSCGKISKIRFNDFQQGKKCSKCGIKKVSEQRKFTFKYIRQYFKDHGCELLETEYIDSGTKMKYKCNCGNKSEIRFDDFKTGYRCRKCGIKKISGKNNYNYNYNKTDEERIIERHYPAYYQWRTKVYKNDYWTCQCCSQIGKKLNAHHIQNYSSYKDLRLAVSNGITLCSTCHQKFHSIYTKKNNTFSQLEEFLSEFKSKVRIDDKVIVSV